MYCPRMRTASRLTFQEQAQPFSSSQTSWGDVIMASSCVSQEPQEGPGLSVNLPLVRPLTPQSVTECDLLNASLFAESK
jgi:hypothetical protein